MRKDVIRSGSKVSGGALVLPGGVPLLVGPQDTEFCERVGFGGEPRASGLFEARLEDMIVAGFDGAASDEQIAGEAPG